MTWASSEYHRMPNTSRRRIDWASVALTVVGVLGCVLAYLSSASVIETAVLMVPGMVATVTGALHIFKYEAPRSK